MDDTNILLNKYFKIYTEGKKSLKVNKEQAFEYFRESLELLSELKKNHKDKIQKHKSLLDQSETECHKYITLTIESSIETEFNEIDKINNSNLFKNLETGNLDLIKKAKYGQINFKEMINNQTILHWAIKYGDTTFLKNAFKLGARIDTINSNGFTLLEFACIEKDPNMIEFLGLYGANMRKHLYFREGTIKYNLINDSIDINILLKLILSYTMLEDKNNKIYNKIKMIKNIFNLNEKINMNDYTYADLFIGLTNLLNKLPEDSALSYLDIISEELSYTIANKLGCPINKLELLLVNLVPFIEYPFNITIDWVWSLELKYLILNIIKRKINNIDIKKDLLEKIWSIYIKNEIIQEDYLGCLLSQWIAKIKV
jgi:hypothetical protein